MTTGEPVQQPLISKSEAKAQGLKRYFTGEPCKYGHVAERLVTCCTCVICHRFQGVKWQNQNKDKVRSYQRKSASKRLRQFTEEINARRREIYSKNPERVLKRNSTWRKSNGDKVVVCNRNVRARKRDCVGSHTAEEILLLFTKQNGKCAYCFTKLKSKPHADHIVPLIKGGTNFIANIAISCAPCNLKKNAKAPEKFALELGRLI